MSVALIGLIVAAALVALIIVAIAVAASAITNRNRRHAAPPPATGYTTSAELANLVQHRQDHYREERKRILQMVHDGRLSGDEAERLLATLERETTTRACPHCSGEIHVSAIKCRHCRQFLVTPQRPTGPLTRSDDRILAGVCAGVAAHFGVDPSLVRILAVVLVLATGILPGLLAYLVMALVVPPAPGPRSAGV